MAAKARMIRKQFFITVDQNRRLKAIAAATGAAEAEIVRAGIEHQLARHDADNDDWRARLHAWCDAHEPMEGLARRVEQNKKLDAARWRKRLTRTRKLLGPG